MCGRKLKRGYWLLVAFVWLFLGLSSVQSEEVMVIPMETWIQIQEEFQGLKSTISNLKTSFEETEKQWTQRYETLDYSLKTEKIISQNLKNSLDKQEKKTASWKVFGLIELGILVGGGLVIWLL